MNSTFFFEIHTACWFYFFFFLMFFSLFHQNGVMSGLMQMLLLKVSAHITEQLGMAPGGEFREAFKEVRTWNGFSEVKILAFCSQSRTKLNQLLVTRKEHFGHTCAEACEGVRIIFGFKVYSKVQRFVALSGMKATPDRLQIRVFPDISDGISFHFINYLFCSC